MKKALKRVGIALGIAVVVGFLAFLYLIPPFTLVSPENFIKPEAAAPPALDQIKDPAERMLADRGKYIVTLARCTECHTTPGPQGPNWTLYMAGGAKILTTGHGTVISRNLTADAETGLGRRSDEEIRRSLRSGIVQDGRAMFYRSMPWASFSNWTDEDLHAVVVYLRHLKPIRHPTPDASAGDSIEDPSAIEADYFGKDYGGTPPTAR